MFASVRACNTRDVHVHVQSLGTDVNLITAKLVCVCVCVCVLSYVLVDSSVQVDDMQINRK